MINYQELDKLQQIGDPIALTSYLINMDDQTQRYTFLWVPTNYSYQADNNFSTNYSMFGTKPHTTFINSNVGTLSINNLEYYSPCHSRSMTSIKNDLEALRLPAKGKLSPPKLSWVTGNAVIQPLYLQSIRVNQLDQLNGHSTALSLNINFIGAEQIEFK